MLLKAEKENGKKSGIFFVKNQGLASENQKKSD